MAIFAIKLGFSFGARIRPKSSFQVCDVITLIKTDELA